MMEDKDVTGYAAKAIITNLDQAVARVAELHQAYEDGVLGYTDQKRADADLIDIAAAYPDTVLAVMDALMVKDYSPETGYCDSHDALRDVQLVAMRSMINVDAERGTEYTDQVVSKFLDYLDDVALAYSDIVRDCVEDLYEDLSKPRAGSPYTVSPKAKNQIQKFWNEMNAPPVSFDTGLINRLGD